MQTKRLLRTDQVNHSGNILPFYSPDDRHCQDVAY